MAGMAGMTGMAGVTGMAGRAGTAEVTPLRQTANDAIEGTLRMAGITGCISRDRPCSREDALARKLLAQLTCPHCWHQCRAEDLLWVSTHPELRGDRLLTIDAPLRFLPSRFSPRGDAIDPAGSTCHELACPHCHLILPPILLERPLTVFSIAGSPGCGKSCYLASAIWEMRRTFPGTFHLAIADADPAANQPVSRIEQSLFLADHPERPISVEKTPTDGGPYSSVQFDPGQTTLLARPFVYTLRPVDRHPNAQAAADRAQVLCLYDNAGEHFLPGAGAAAQPGTEHLARSSVVLFLFDPTQDVRFRNLLSAISTDPQVGQRARSFRQDLVLTEVANRIRSRAALPANERIRKALMLLVSKADIWEKLVAEDLAGEPFWTEQDERHAWGKMDTRRVDRVSAAVRAMLQRFAPELVATAEDAFERVVYVPVSALGASPTDADGVLSVTPAQLRPRWVTVPFAYAFSRWATTLIASNKSETDGA